MKIFRSVLAVVLASVWISFSEFFRNDILIKSLWEEHYKAMGLIFPSAPVNGVLWGFWSLLCSIAIFYLIERFSVLKTTLLSWLFAFVMMWVALGNLDALPYRTLIYAIPLSLLEIFVATIIIKRVVYLKK